MDVRKRNLLAVFVVILAAGLSLAVLLNPGSDLSGQAAASKYPQCGKAVNTCLTGSFVDAPDTATAYNWQCSLRKLAAQCSLPKPVPGRCGTALNNCTAGKFRDAADSGIYSNWQCVGLNGGATVSCNLVSCAVGVSLSNVKTGLPIDVMVPMADYISVNRSTTANIKAGSSVITARLDEGPFAEGDIVVLGKAIISISDIRYWDNAVDVAYYVWNPVSSGWKGSGNSICTLSAAGNSTYTVEGRPWAYLQSRGLELSGVCQNSKFVYLQLSAGAEEGQLWINKDSDGSFDTFKNCTSLGTSPCAADAGCPAGTACIGFACI
jgi:hypothetical protein